MIVEINESNIQSLILKLKETEIYRVSEVSIRESIRYFRFDGIMTAQLVVYNDKPVIANVYDCNYIDEIVLDKNNFNFLYELYMVEGPFRMTFRIGSIPKI